MKLTPEDIVLFKALNTSQVGKDLLGYLERVKLDLGDLASLTPENLPVRRGVAQLLDEHLINRIKLINQDKQSNNNQYV